MKIIYTINYRSKHYKEILFLVMFCSVIGKSYSQSNNEISFSLKGSFSKLDYEVLQQQNDMEEGLSFGVGYSFFISENWSVGTGVELQYIESSAHLSSIEDSYTTVDMEGEDFEFRYRAENFSENQSAYFINVPVQIQYESSGVTKFYAAGGLSTGFVLQSKYETEVSSIITSGYYEQYDAELKDPQFAGFGNFGPVKYNKSDLGLKTNLVLNLDSGVKFMLENDRALYLGFFIDYGLKDIQPENNQRNLFAYNPENPANFENASLLTSINRNNSTDFTGEVKTLAFGLKLQYAFQF